MSGALPPAVVFGTSACPYCKRAKAALRERGLAFADVNVGDDAALVKALHEATGRRTVPQSTYGTRRGG
jgi:glutaredoxin 3